MLLEQEGLRAEVFPLQRKIKITRDHPHLVGIFLCNEWAAITTSAHFL